MPRDQRAHRALQPTSLQTAVIVELAVEVRANITQLLGLLAPDPERVLHHGQWEGFRQVHLDWIGDDTRFLRGVGVSAV